MTLYPERGTDQWSDGAAAYRFRCTACDFEFLADLRHESEFFHSHADKAHPDGRANRERIAVIYTTELGWIDRKGVGQ